MGDGLKSTCVVKDPTGQQCNVSVYFEPGIIGNWFDKSSQLKDAIESLSVAKVVKRSDNYSVTEQDVQKGTVIGAYGTVDQKAIILLRESWTGKTRRVEIPAPKEDIFKQVEDQGFRVKEVNGLAFATLYSGMLPSGKSVTFQRGWLKSKK